MRASRIVARHYVVRGRVQGVGYRFFVVRCAQNLNLTGYVRNRTDGSVEVYAAGSHEDLSILQHRLWSGPRLSLVDSVEEREAEVRPLKTFSVEF